MPPRSSPSLTRCQRNEKGERLESGVIVALSGERKQSGRSIDVVAMVNAVLTYQNIPTGYQASLSLFLSFFVSVSLTIREDTPSSLVAFASSLLGTRSDISSRLHRLSLSPFSVAFFLFHRGPWFLLRALCPSYSGVKRQSLEACR